MTDPKNTEDQKLSLDQLKYAAGGFGAKMNRMVSTHDEAGDDVLKKNADSLRSDNRF